MILLMSFSSLDLQAAWHILDPNGQIIPQHEFPSKVGCLQTLARLHIRTP
jgi:hypothetical protein